MTKLRQSVESNGLECAGVEISEASFKKDTNVQNSLTNTRGLLVGVLKFCKPALPSEWWCQWWRYVCAVKGFFISTRSSTLF